MSVSPEYIGYRLEAFIGVFTPICVVATALRFYARSLVVRHYDAGDWLIIAALIGQLVAGGIAVGAVRKGGVGYHAGYLEETDPEKITTFLKYLVAMSTWYATTEGLAKLAVCLLYKRIFPQKSLHIIVNITMFILIGASLGGGLADLFGCTPFSAHWGSNEEQAKYCVDTEALFVWGSFPNIVTDAILLVVPIPTVWKLHASMGMRMGLVVTFLFGSIGIITSILRFIAFYNKDSFSDPTYNGVELIIWTVCEPGVYLIAACLLVYRPLLDKLGISTLITGVTAHGKSGGGSGGGRRSAKMAEWGPRSTESKDISLNSMGGAHHGGGAQQYGDGAQYYGGGAQYYGGGISGGSGVGGGGVGGSGGIGGGDARYGSTVVGGGFQRLYDDGDGDERPLRKGDGITATTDIEIAWEARHGGIAR